MKRFLILGYLITLTEVIFAQVKITGTVVSATDGKPLGFATVFINNTSKGGTTTEKGSFSIGGIVAGRYELIASYVGYETASNYLDINTEDVNIKITLQPKATVLKAFEVKRDPKREAYIKTFKETFIGKTDFAKNCVLTNDEILDIGYDNAEQALKASTEDYLIINNAALGYKIRFMLKQYVNSDRDHTISYYGYAFYESMTTKKKAQMRQWLANRETVFHGSSLHFFRSLIEGNTEEEGFVVNEIVRRPRQRGYVHDTIVKNGKIMLNRDAYSDDSNYVNYRIPIALRPVDLMKPSDSLVDKYVLHCENMLMVSYMKELEANKYAIMMGRLPRQQESMIRFFQPDCTFSKEGVCVDPLAMLFSGYWGFEKLADQVPYDYVSTSRK
ncbi:carboxypeptidase-like regulatory domain-containing protein [Chitinophaga sancti]|uniref:carboxypeptidase-like regulatory domain-containing protein n=1 Tax=Chitinophaga sancti TaxID=1004 RepID=UPI002A74C888|nr:carboxypeptidase-like regulatory domain-containing protein [Chitinophaga sancti]WPQ63090.1 carboxypeptidase-like regulatory domain-containing protein [Chitinophaga sancti]